MTQAVRSDDITNVHRCTVKPAVGETVGIVSQLCVSMASHDFTIFISLVSLYLEDGLR